MSHSPTLTCTLTYTLTHKHCNVHTISSLHKHTQHILLQDPHTHGVAQYGTTYLHVGKTRRDTLWFWSLSTPPGSIESNTTPPVDLLQIRRPESSTLPNTISPLTHPSPRIHSPRRRTHRPLSTTFGSHRQSMVGPLRREPYGEVQITEPSSCNPFLRLLLRRQSILSRGIH